MLSIANRFEATEHFHPAIDSSTINVLAFSPDIRHALTVFGDRAIARIAAVADEGSVPTQRAVMMGAAVRATTHYATDAGIERMGAGAAGRPVTGSASRASRPVSSGRMV